MIGGNHVSDGLAGCFGAPRDVYKNIPHSTIRMATRSAGCAECCGMFLSLARVKRSWPSDMRTQVRHMISRALSVRKTSRTSRNIPLDAIVNPAQHPAGTKNIPQGGPTP